MNAARSEEEEDLFVFNDTSDHPQGPEEHTGG